MAGVPQQCGRRPLARSTSRACCHAWSWHSSRIPPTHPVLNAPTQPTYIQKSFAFNEQNSMPHEMFRPGAAWSHLGDRCATCSACLGSPTNLVSFQIYRHKGVSVLVWPMLQNRSLCSAHFLCRPSFKIYGLFGRDSPLRKVSLDLGFTMDDRGSTRELFGYTTTPDPRNWGFCGNIG
jgi:hypothetical protein